MLKNIKSHTISASFKDQSKGITAYFIMDDESPHKSVCYMSDYPNGYDDNVPLFGHLYDLLVFFVNKYKAEGFDEITFGRLGKEMMKEVSRVIYHELSIEDATELIFISDLAFCPRCSRVYQEGTEAISRKDNKTALCTDCGVDEALENMY